MAQEKFVLPRIPTREEMEKHYKAVKIRSTDRDLLKSWADKSGLSFCEIVARCVQFCEDNLEWRSFI